MKRTIPGVLVCMLLIATVFPVVKSTNNGEMPSPFPSCFTSQSCSDENWIETHILFALDGQDYDRFGISVSLDEDNALIGASYDNDNGEYSGSAYIFTRSGSTWVQQQKLLPPDGMEGARFGESVSLDGDTALIGAPFDDGNGECSGAAYVFTRIGNVWSLQTKLLAPDGEPQDQFGSAVSLYGDTALIGARGDDISKGSVYVFTRTGTTWSFQTKIFILEDGQKAFGCSVSLSGETALIGARWDDDNGINSGSAYIFTRSGTNWIIQAKLIASDGSEGDSFGTSVCLSSDTAIIGAIFDDVGGTDSGSAYAFKRTGTTWVQQQKLFASDGAATDNFGYSVSVDGDTAFIGAWQNDENGYNTGAVYVFTRSGTTWTNQQKLYASNSTYDDFFGASVSLLDDTAFIGAVTHKNNDVWSGSIYVFEKETENQPPDKPSINGPTTVVVDEETSYTFIAIDPEDDNIYYEIDWGDGTTDSWFGPFVSNVVIQKSHTWDNKGRAIIKARAKDIHGAIGNWEYMSITVPYSYNLPFMQCWIRLCERFPNAFLILRHVLGY